MPTYTRQPTPFYLEAAADNTQLLEVVDIEQHRKPGEWPVILSACAVATNDAAIGTTHTVEVFFVPRSASGGSTPNATTASRAQERTPVAKTTGGGSVVLTDEPVPADAERIPQACRIGVDIASVDTNDRAAFRLTVGWIAMPEPNYADC